MEGIIYLLGRSKEINTYITWKKGGSKVCDMKSTYVFGRVTAYHNHTTSLKCRSSDHSSTNGSSEGREWEIDSHHLTHVGCCLDTGWSSNWIHGCLWAAEFLTWCFVGLCLSKYWDLLISGYHAGFGSMFWWHRSHSKAPSCLNAGWVSCILSVVIRERTCVYSSYQLLKTVFKWHPKAPGLLFWLDNVVLT